MLQNGSLPSDDAPFDQEHIAVTEPIGLHGCSQCVEVLLNDARHERRQGRDIVPEHFLASQEDAERRQYLPVSTRRRLQVELPEERPESAGVYSELSSGVSVVYSSEATGELGVRGPSSARGRSRTPKPRQPSPKPSSVPQAETKVEHPGSRYIIPKSARRTKSAEASKPKEQKQKAGDPKPEGPKKKKQASPEKPRPEIIDTASGPVLANRPKSLPKQAPLNIAREVPRSKTPDGR